MRRSCTLALVSLAGMAWTQAALAQSLLQFTADRRECSGYVRGGGTGRSWDDLRGVPLAGDYQGGSTITATNELNETVVGGSTQRSWTDGSSMTFRATASASALPPQLMQLALAEGVSRFELEFTTTQPLVYTLTGTMGEGGFPGSEVTLLVQRLGAASPALQLVNNGSSMESVLRTGELAAGPYRIVCLTRAKAETPRGTPAVEGSAHSDFVFRVAVPASTPTPPTTPPATPLVVTPPPSTQPSPAPSGRQPRARGDARRNGGSASPSTSQGPSSPSGSGSSSSGAGPSTSPPAAQPSGGSGASGDSSRTRRGAARRAR